ncbi:hypothetical protein [Sorangium cellulosum]|nr:hypothetical protein [Sorangium cellulosum]
MRCLRMLVMAAWCGLGCTVVDPGDRADLRDVIASLPPSQVDAMRLLTMNSNTIQYLSNRPEEDQVGKYECRTRIGDAYGSWQQLGRSLTVAELLKCLRAPQLEAQYVPCANAWASVMQKRADASFERLGLKGECRFVWDVRYEPDKLPEDCVDPDTITPDDMIDAMIGYAGRVPPPLAGGLPGGFLAKLCKLPLADHGAWGCPEAPGYTSGAGGASSSTGGDYP